MAAKKSTQTNAEAVETAATEASQEAVSGETVTVDKQTLETILSDYKALKAQVQQISESTSAGVKAKQLEQEKKLQEEIAKANEAAEEEIEYTAPTGSMKSNKNIEVNVNGVQYIVPRGKKVKVKRKVVEVIENAIKQNEFAAGVQEAARQAAETSASELNG